MSEQRPVVDGARTAVEVRTIGLGMIERITAELADIAEQERRLKERRRDLFQERAAAERLLAEADRIEHLSKSDAEHVFDNFLEPKPKRVRPRTEHTAAIVSAVHSAAGPISAREISLMTGYDSETVRTALKYSVRKGEIRSVGRATYESTNAKAPGL